MRYLTEKDRYYIEIELKKKTPVSVIASSLGFDRSTIYKEIKKGKCVQRNSADWSLKQVYLSDYSQNKTVTNLSKRGAKRKLLQDDSFLNAVSDIILNEKYSPEAALYKLKNKKCCVKTIYNYIHSGYLKNVTVVNLPYANIRKKSKSKVVKRPFSRGRSIELRPKDILERNEYGHWEMDTVYSSRDDLTCLLVLTERKTREELMFKIPNRTSQSVVNCLNRLERKIGCAAFRNKFKTITCDNGMEFADWEGIEKSIRNKTPRTVTYFCHPYASSERGSNENLNRMIRRWIPKGDDIGLYSDKEIQNIQDWINNYPRKMFNGKSSYQV